MKNIVVLISEAPSVSVAEKLRMSVGLTLEDDNSVTVLMIDDGVYASMGVDHEKSGYVIDKHIDTVKMMKHKVLASKTSAEKRGLDLSGGRAEPVGDDEVKSTINNADIFF